MCLTDFWWQNIVELNHWFLVQIFPLPQCFKNKLVQLFFILICDALTHFRGVFPFNPHCKHKKTSNLSREQKGDIDLKWSKNLIKACKFTRTRVHQDGGFHNTFFETLHGSEGKNKKFKKFYSKKFHESLVTCMPKAKAYLEPIWTSKIKPFGENSQRLIVNFCFKKIGRYMPLLCSFQIHCTLLMLHLLV